MRNVSSIVRGCSLALSLAIVTIMAASIAGCPKDNAASEPDAPKCRNGFRNQCVADVAVGSSFACALLADRTVWCWGKNDRGQLGYATTDLCPEDIGGGKTRSVACHTFPFQVSALDGVVDVRAGTSFGCAVGAEGGVRCWGGNTAGELGNGSSTTSQTPVAVASLAKVEAITLGSHHACALSEGQVYCWGANDHGQLGVQTTGACTVDGATIPCATRPVAVATMTNVTALSAGAGHTCALSKDGTVTCWGDNRFGQLGVGVGGDSPASLSPVLVAVDTQLDSVTSIAAGAFHTCALRDGGSVVCWGRDDHRELGAPPPPSGPQGCTGPCSALAVVVPDLPSPIEQVDAGPIDDGGALDGATTDAGAETSPASGDAIADTTASTPDGSDDTGPTIADAATDARGPTVGTFHRALTSGDSYSCLRVGDGTVRCWGFDGVGQLGDGRTTNDPRGATLVIASPGAAADNPLQGVAKVQAGGTSACAVMSDDSLRCWGSNQDGALGAGHFTPYQGPVPVSW